MLRRHCGLALVDTLYPPYRRYGHQPDELTKAADVLTKRSNTTTWSLPTQ
jgi:hypothetical protein